MRLYIIVIVLVVVLFGLYLLSNVIADNIDTDFDIKGVDLDISSFGPVKTRLGIIVKNKNIFSIVVKNLYFEVFYKEKMMLKSDGYIKEFDIKRKSSTKNNISVILYPSLQLIDFAARMTAEKDVEIKYNTSFKILGITIKLTDRPYKIEF